MKSAAALLVACLASSAADIVAAPDQAGKENTAFPEARLQALVGQMARICGPVVEYACRADHDSQLDLATHPTQPGVSVRVPVASRPKFGLAFEGRVFGRNVCATGPITRDGLRFLVQVDEPAEVSIESGGEPAGAPPDLVVPCDQGVTMPKLRREVKPSYTDSALGAGIHGVVWLNTIVGVDGTPASIRVVRSLDQRLGLDEEAVKALRQWRFTPAQHNGQAAPIQLIVEMFFTLRP